MATVDFGPRQPSFMETLLAGVGQGLGTYGKVREMRREQAEDERVRRLNNLLSAGEGPLSPEDASFLQSEGLSSRVGLDNAIQGQYRVLPTTKQMREKALADKYFGAEQRALEEDERSEGVRKWLMSQQGLDPFQQAEAFTRGGVEVPKYVMDLINAKQAQDLARERAALIAAERTRADDMRRRTDLLREAMRNGYVQGDQVKRILENMGWE